jgi:GTP diphosphokinase / guanosine-3',5'-bis(diphosphate) 3'-diphosphatase
MSVLEKAIRLAVEAHAGQVDKAGRPYILHPFAVMFAAERAYRPSLLVFLEEFMAAAVLHDVPEDFPEKYPLSYILAEFGENVHRIVAGVTRRKAQGESYREFIIRANEDPGSRLLKILDIYHNLGRIHLLPIEEQSIRRRYEKALVILNHAEFSFLEEVYLWSSHLIRPEENRREIK